MTDAVHTPSDHPQSERGCNALTSLEEPRSKWQSGEKATASEPVIGRWSDCFRRNALARTVVLGLRARAEEIWERSLDLLRRDSPEFRHSVDGSLIQESRLHHSGLLLLISAVAAARHGSASSDPLDLVRTHARWYARHRIPIVVGLHAYRVAHRTYHELSQEALREHANPGDVVFAQRFLAEFWIEFFDHVGQVLAQAYATEDATIVARETQAYGRLMSELLRGNMPSDPQLQRLCALRGIRTHGSLAVVVVKALSFSDHHFVRESALRSLERCLEEALSGASLGTLIQVSDDAVTGVVSSHGSAGTDVHQALSRARFAQSAKHEQTAVAGIGTDVHEIAHLPQALEEALMAAELATESQPLVRCSETLLPALLISRADKAVARLVPEWARRLHTAYHGTSQELVRTIRAFTDCDFNVKSTAHKLHVHTNTIYFRLNQLKKISSLDPRTFAGASVILAALNLLDSQLRVARQPGGLREAVESAGPATHATRCAPVDLPTSCPDRR